MRAECCVAGMGQDLAVSRLLRSESGAVRSESGAHQFRGAHRSARSERMECACGVNAESEDAEYRAEHHLVWSGETVCRTYVKCFCVL